MEVLISPIKKAEWKINKVDFITHLTKKYRNVIIHEIKDERRKYCYEWKIQSDEFFLDGLLDKALNCVCITTNSPEFGSEFAKWVRNFMPKDEDIIIYDKSYENHILINVDTQVNDIIALFG